MWPLEPARSTEVLRVGRLAVERWQGGKDRWALAERQALPTDGLDAPARMEAAIAALYAERPAAVEIVVESAWLPVILAGTGGQLLTQQQAGELVRHRLGMLQGPGGAAMASWDIRVDYRVGERFVLGYGCPPGISVLLRSSVESLGIQAASLTPAFLWGWQRMPTHEGWRLWEEQDRWLGAAFHAARVVGLNAALSPATDEQEIERLVDVEAVRLGLESTACRIDAVVWGSPRADATRPSRVDWRGLGAARAAAAPPAMAAVESSS